MTDGYAPYDDVANTYQLVHLGCWAHARRYLVEAEQALPRATHEVAYDLVNNDVDAMVRVQQGALTYAVTSYVDSSHFREAWLDITNALDDVQVSTVTRLGLRGD